MEAFTHDLLVTQWTSSLIILNIRREAFSVIVTHLKSPYDTKKTIYITKQVKYLISIEDRVLGLFTQ